MNGWYEKISLQYTGSITNSISTKDNLLFKTPLTQWENGMQHKIPVSATFNLFKYINIVLRSIIRSAGICGK